MAEWQRRPRTRHLESRQSASAYHNDRACLDVGEIPARQCSQLLVPPARRLRARPDPPHLDRSTRAQAAHCSLEIHQPWRDPGGCYRKASLRLSEKAESFASSTRPDQPRRIRAGGPSQTVAVICRNTVWTRSPEPDDLRMRDYGVSRSEAATECEVLQASKPQSTMGSSHGSDTARCTRPAGQQDPVDLPLRLDDAAASPTTPQGQHQ